jgi:hypothetical protein
MLKFVGKTKYGNNIRSEIEKLHKEIYKWFGVRHLRDPSLGIGIKTVLCSLT